MLAAVAAALVLAAVANAKLTSVAVSAPASAPRTDVPYTITVHVSLRGKPYTKPGYRPTLYLIRKGAFIPAATSYGTAVGPGTFRVRIVFPRPGSWRYVIPDPLNGEWSFDAPRVTA
jgi:hypothetical protein